MEITVNLLSEIQKSETYKSLFFNIAYLDKEQLQISQNIPSVPSPVCFDQQTLLITTEHLQSFLQEKTGQTGYTSTNISFLLNSIINIELYSILSLQELNSKDKSQDLTFNYLETCYINIHDFIISANCQKVNLSFLNQDLAFEISVIFTEILDLSGSTIGNIQYNLQNFPQEFYNPGFTYVANCKISDTIKFSQFFEIVEEKFTTSNYQRTIFPSYKELFEVASSSIQMFANVLKIEPLLSKSPKPGVVNCAFRAYQDPLEVSILQRKTALNNNYFLFFSKEDRETASDLFENEIVLLPDLASKLTITFKKLTDKSTFQSSFAAPFIWPDCKNISRKQFYSSSEPDLKDPKNFTLNSTFKFTGLDQKASFTASNVPFLPYDSELFNTEVSTSEIPQIRGKKDPKQSMFSTYPEGQVNRIWLNEICGINFLLQKLQFNINNINSIGQTTPFIANLLENYQKSMRNVQIAQNTIKQIYKILEINEIAGNEYQKPVMTLISLDFKFPIILKQIRSIQGGNIDEIKTYLSRNFNVKIQSLTPELDFSSIKNTTISFVQDLQDKFFINSITQEAGNDIGVASNLTQIKALKKLQMNKQYALRGLQGAAQQKSIAVPKAVNQESQQDFTNFGQIVQGDGMIDMLLRQILPVLYNYLQQGFPTKKDMISYLVSLVSSQVSVDVFQELQDRKEEEKLKREEMEQIELEKLSKQHSDSRPTSGKNEDKNKPSMKMFKSIKVSDELSSALLKIHNQLELEKKLKHDEKNLTVKESELTTEQVQLHKNIQSTLYLAAADNKRYAELAFKKVQAIITRIIPGNVMHQVGVQMSMLKDTLSFEYASQLLTSYLISGLKLSQPHAVQSLEDVERMKKYVYSPTAFVEQIVQYQPQLISADVVIISICNIVNKSFYNIIENKHEALDQLLIDDNVREQLEQVQQKVLSVQHNSDQQYISKSSESIPKLNISMQSQGAPSSGREGYNSVNRNQNTLIGNDTQLINLTILQTTKEKQVYRQPENQTIVLLFQQLLDQSEHFQLNLLTGWNLGSVEKYKQSEMKQDILNKLLDNNFRSSDVALILEILGLPEIEENQHQYNTVLKTQMVVNKDETGKKITKNESLLEDAETKEVNISLQPVPEWVIGGFIFMLYHKNILTAKTISNCIFNSIKKLVIKYDQKFRNLIEKVQELDIMNQAEQQSVPTVPQPLQQLGSLKKNGSILGSSNQSFSCSAMNTITQQVYQKMKSIRTTLSMTKYQTQNQLLAVQDYLLNDTPNFKHILPLLDQFDNEDAFITHIVDSTLPKVKIQGGSQTRIAQKISCLLSLAEFLSIRSETHMAQITSELAKKLMFEQANIDNVAIQHLFIRSHFISLRKLFNEKKFNEVLQYIELIKDGEFGQALSNRIKTCPQFSYLKAKSLYYLKGDQFISKEQIALVDQEIFKNAYNAYLQAQKVKEFDDFYRGSTSIGEASFFDFAFSQNLLDTMMLSIGIIDYLQPKVKTPQQEYNNLQTDTAFLKAKMRADVQEEINLNDEIMFIDGNMDFLGENNSPIEEVKKTFTKPISVDLFRQKKQDIINGGGDRKYISPDKKFPSSKKVGKSSENPSSAILTNFISAPEDSVEKDKTKTLFVMASAIKQFLEQNPGFGPAWSLYALLQMTLKNMTDARLSSSIATVLNPEIVDCWAVWACCEILNAVDQHNIQWLLDQFKEQIQAMGVEESKIEWLWQYSLDFIKNK
ncbi:hypothetical protein SS50377_23689 [Spironucleus salmonicida]|uniref:Uncharacterized protein n=1 Tax=Spironucleus salmonicida TaxID=348837 RepID=V6LY96_9EUKA|nr:hypothetical protein SS50377_23689 [Spironucleus salmonicida]|eukprot:EST48671.1 hypothetical protein SS50377_11284 [Spironucleus salmonicida]